MTLIQLFIILLKVNLVKFSKNMLRSQFIPKKERKKIYSKKGNK